MPRAVWPPYRPVRELIHAHRGRAAVIMGGGISMPVGLDQAPADALYISINDHGVRRFKREPKRYAGRVISYVVACDDIEKRARFDVGKGGDGSPWNIPVISRHMWADWRVLFMAGPSSGKVGAWFARLLGCSPIILTGIDLYIGGTYHDDPKAESTGKLLTDLQHLQNWNKMVKQFPAMYRTIGCHPKLTKALGRYDPAEPVQACASAEIIESGMGGRWATLTRDCEVSGRPFKAGAYEFQVAEVENIARNKRGKAGRRVK